MLAKIILLQILAHILADFVFQSQRWSDKKSERVLSWQHFYHILGVFSLSYLLSFDFGFWKASLAITILHLGTDIFKSFISLKTRNRKSNRTYFFLDQSIHLITIVVVSALYHHIFPGEMIINPELKFIAIVTAFVLCAKPSNIIIKNILTTFSVDFPFEKSKEAQTLEDRSLPNAGKLIGISERFLALALILIGQYSAVGLIIAAKSRLRFKSTQKNEYILVGTLLSFGIAGLAGIAIRHFL